MFNKCWEVQAVILAPVGRARSLKGLNPTLPVRHLQTFLLFLKDKQIGK